MEIVYFFKNYNDESFENIGKFFTLVIIIMILFVFNTIIMIFFLSLGSNISPRHHYIDAACGLIEQRVGHIFRRSSDFYSAPWGYQSDHEYLNIAVKLSSSLSPEQLLAATQLIERELGRTVKNHYQDRTIDIDIISAFSVPSSVSADSVPVSLSTHAESVSAPSFAPLNGLPPSADNVADEEPACGEPVYICTPDLVIPHPLAFQRPFVLVPLREISAGFPLPVTKTTRQKDGKRTAKGRQQDGNDT